MYFDTVKNDIMFVMDPFVMLAVVAVVSAYILPNISGWLFSDKERLTYDENPEYYIEEKYVPVCFDIQGVDKQPNAYENIDLYNLHFLIMNTSRTTPEYLQRRNELIRSAGLDYEITSNDDLYITTSADDVLRVWGFLSDLTTKDMRYVFIYDNYYGKDQEQVLKHYLDLPHILSDFNYGFVNLKYMYYLLKSYSSTQVQWYKTETDNTINFTDETETTYEPQESTRDDSENEKEPSLSKEIRVEQNTIITDLESEEPPVLKTLRAHYSALREMCKEKFLDPDELELEVMSNMS